MCPLLGGAAVSRYLGTCSIPFGVWFAVGEEDEVSIKDIAYMVAEAMDFKGEVIVS